MYTKEQASKLRQKFWTVFGQYMKPVPGANGGIVNWINYKTGIGNVFFRMDAGKEQTIVCIELRHTNEAERMQCYKQFMSLKNMLQQTTGYEWNWQPAMQDEQGQNISRIWQSAENINILNENDWPAIIAFLKPRMMALDNFWELVKDAFE
jgi:hypothetical protein